MKFNFRGREVHPHHRHINFLLVITIFLIIIIAVLIKPALLGYRISKQIEDIWIKPAEFLRSTDTLKSKLLVAETNLETCKSFDLSVSVLLKNSAGLIPMSSICFDIL